MHVEWSRGCAFEYSTLRMNKNPVYSIHAETLQLRCFDKKKRTAQLLAVVFIIYEDFKTFGSDGGPPFVKVFSVWWEGGRFKSHI